MAYGKEGCFAHQHYKSHINVYKQSLPYFIVYHLAPGPRIGVGNVTLHMRALHIRAMLHMRAIFHNCFLEQRNCFLLFINNYLW